MTLTVEDIARLTAMGNKVRISSTGALSVEPMAQRRTSTDRVKAFRARKETVETPETEGTAETHETVKRDETLETHVKHSGENGPPPSPPPPLSPTPPLTPAPTPAPVSTPARTREAAKDDRAIADEASAAQLPLTLHAHAGFRAAWAEWCGYRTERATVPLKSARVPWTLRAATNLLSECERLAPMLGLDAIAARIREAIASNWKGPCLTDIRTPRPPTNGAPAKSHQPERLHTSI